MLDPFTRIACAAVWQPAADVYHARWGWLVKYDLAGVRLGDVSLQVDNDCLVLTGTRRDFIAEEGCRPHRLEISYSRFERTLKFPCPIGGFLITLEQRDGMLLVRMENGS